MRQLRFHEKKLLKKVDLLSWKGENNVREATVLRRYAVSDREDYDRYAKMVGHIQHLAARLQKLDAQDPFRVKVTDMLVEKLYSMGVLNGRTGLTGATAVTVSCFCRRRLPVVMVKNKFCESLQESTSFIQQGHVRIGPDVVTDPSMIVSRAQEDFITWVDQSKIKKAVLEYQGLRDDYED